MNNEMDLVGYLITVNAEGYFQRVIDIKRESIYVNLLIKKKGNMFNS